MNKMYKSLLCLLLYHITCLSVKATLTRSPIIIVPGILGNRLEAKLDKPSVVNKYCKKKSDWYTLWIDLKILIPKYEACIVDNMELQYDPATKQYHNATGVDIRVPAFGGTDSVEYLTSGGFKFGYFTHFVKHFEQRGYTRGKDIRAAPYDWRFAPDVLEMLGYFDALYQLIEDTYTTNNNTPVSIVVHSMGGPITVYFLAHIAKPDWKASRIKQFISLSGAFGGSVRAIKGLVAGDSFMDLIKPQILQKAQRTFPSQLWLLPYPKLWDSQEIIFSQPKRNYTAHDFKSLFVDMNYTDGLRILTEVQNLTSDFPAPNVVHYCFYGNNVSTISSITQNTFPGGEIQVKNGNGDGTANIRSLKSCSLWSGKQKQPVILKGFDGVEHIEMVMNQEVIKSVEELVITN